MTNLKQLVNASDATDDIINCSPLMLIVAQFPMYNFSSQTTSLNVRNRILYPQTWRDVASMPIYHAFLLLPTFAFNADNSVMIAIRGIPL